MSAAHDAHADASAGHQDTHNHFDNEPATELGADETRTANWVPYLGLALFFSAGLACLMCSDGDKLADGKAVAAKPAKLAESKGRKRGGAAAAPRAKRVAPKTEASEKADASAKAEGEKKASKRAAKKSSKKSEDS